MLEQCGVSEDRMQGRRVGWETDSGKLDRLPAFLVLVALVALLAVLVIFAVSAMFVLAAGTDSLIFLLP